MFYKNVITQFLAYYFEHFNNGTFLFYRKRHKNVIQPKQIDENSQLQINIL